jgi:hypothetical protein
MALTVDQVRSWLDQIQPLLSEAGLVPADLDIQINSALLRIGITPTDLTVASDLDLVSIPVLSTQRFLQAVLIESKKRVLVHYRTDIDQGVLGAFIRYASRADGLAQDIAADEETYEWLWQLEAAAGGGVAGGPILTGTNIPDAVLISYRA